MEKTTTLTTQWLKDYLPNEYADQINPGWCWWEIGDWYRTAGIPKEITEPIVQMLVETGTEYDCYDYCRYIENREEIVQAMIKIAGGNTCYLYCLEIEDRADVRQAMVDSGDVGACRRYFLYIKNRPEVRAVFENVAGAPKCG